MIDENSWHPAGIDVEFGCVVGFSIEGPSQAKIDCKDNGDGSADVTYFPTAPGEYAVHILCNEDDIPKSPYMVQIQPETKAFNASKVRDAQYWLVMLCMNDQKIKFTWRAITVVEVDQLLIFFLSRTRVPLVDICT